MKKVLSILFAVLFIASLTAVTVSAKGGSYWRVATVAGADTLGGVIATLTEHTLMEQIQGSPT